MESNKRNNNQKDINRYDDKCGSCRHFVYHTKDNQILMRGDCDNAPNNYFNHNNRHGQKYRARHSKYRIASNPKCSRYEKGDE